MPPPAPPADVIAGFATLLAAHTRGAAHLTKRGLALVEAVLTTPVADPPGHPGSAARPEWDRMRRRLRAGGRVVRGFARAAPGQMAVLDALQAAGWPAAEVPNPFRRAGKAGRARRVPLPKMLAARI